MTNTQYIRKNAIIYQRYKDQFNQLGVCDIKRFRDEVERAFYQLPIKTVFVDGQPYANVAELTQDIKAGKPMLISHDNNDSKLLPRVLNLMFRAVHDYLHYTLQAEFNATGEIAVFKLQGKLHSDGISQKILFSEVVLQACFCEYFGKFSESQKIVLL